MVSYIYVFRCAFLVILAGTMLVAGAQTTAPVRINYDLVRPEDDATSQPIAEVTAVSESTKRDEFLKKAVIATDFREVEDATFVNYDGLVRGNDSRGRSGDPYVPTTKTYAGNIGRQPVGPLTGRIIYCSAGHGWTNDNTSTSLWYTQRPITHGIVEDMGNLDQMNLYADLCFRAGATIVPMRPLGFQHVERVIDNESSQAMFHGQWADSQSTESFSFAGAKTPYRFARASAEESAVARFRPVIPVTDEYPVYAWARAGADRVVQTYRVVYAGGVNEVDIDHRRVGSGWVYLGSYIFNRGSNGYVEVTNKVRLAEHAASGGVVIADAIRFGNGMGDVNRGGGVSGFPREEEASRYWAERSLSENAPPIYDGFPDRGDQSNNVGTAPRMSAYMNRESDGNFFDRVFMSFHTNAVGGRGVMGLYNAHAVLRPDKQIELAKLTADELNAEMTLEGIDLSQPWVVRPQRTMAHINFGEIRRDYLNNEMSATIVEVAFHDNAEDAELLRQLSIRESAAEATYRATLRYFNEEGDAGLPFYTPPMAPKLRFVGRGATTGSVKLEWEASQQDPLSSQSENIRYKVYRSADGVAFNTGREVGAVTSYTVDKVESGKAIYFRVTALSEGGESAPSAVLGTALSTGPKVLVVNGGGTTPDDVALTQTAAMNLGWPLIPGGEFTRLVPRVMNNGEQVRSIGNAIRWLNFGFESVDASEFLAGPDLSDYSALCLMLGRNPVPATLATTDTLSMMHDYVTSGGRLLVSGACLAECDDLSTHALARWGEFVRTTLQAEFDPQTTATGVIKSGDRELTTVTLQLGDRSLQYFEPRPTEVLRPEEAGRPLLAYDEFNGGAAAVATLLEQKIRTALIGFPLEELDGRDQQTVLAAQILAAMGLEVPRPPARAEAAIVIEDAGSTGTATSAPAATTTDTLATTITPTAVSITDSPTTR